jgi:hypothetical protein
MDVDLWVPFLCESAQAKAISILSARLGRTVY